MNNNLQKAFLVATALYVFVGALAAFSMISFSQKSSSKNCTQVCLACFKENTPEPKAEEPKPKKIEKITKKEPLAKPAQETPKEEQKPKAQNSAPQMQKPQEIVNPQKQYIDANSKKIKEILIKHANNSYAQKARNIGVTGTCKVSFVLHPDGTVSNKNISDCHMQLQSSAKMAIEDAAPEFPKPHDDCKITTSIDYEIIRG